MLSEFLFTSGSHAVLINEFMPDPDDNISDRSEWVEIFINEPWSYENISIDTGEGRMKINASFMANDYVILTRNASAFIGMWGPQNNIIEYGKMSLSNTEDNITLFNGSVSIQAVAYSRPSRNVSYGFCDGLISAQHVPTPGKENMCVKQPTNQTNETGENFTSGSCNISLSIESPSVFVPGKKENYYIVLEDDNCTEKDVVIEYWIEDMFGDVIKPKYNTTQSVGCLKNVSREWTAEDTLGSEAYYIKASIAGAGCNDTSYHDNYDEKVIAVRGGAPEKNSHIIISDVAVGSDEKAKFGDVVEVAMSVYKGDTSKSSIDVWIESQSGEKVAKTNFNTRSIFSNYSLTVPMQILPNCGGDFDNGSYLVKAEGLDSYDEAVVIIEGNSAALCKTKTIETSKPCTCPACQPCKCDNKSAGISPKEANNKTANLNDTQESSSSAGKTKAAKASDNVSKFPGVIQTRNATNGTQEIRTPTGKIVSETEENWLSLAVSGMMNFFKNLLKL
jgi:hypothetical protein